MIEANFLVPPPDERGTDIARGFTDIVHEELGMQTMTPLFGSEKSDPQTIRQWAAEDFAINIGWLRECPFHGQPFKAKLVNRRKLAPALVDPLDPNVRVFNGNARELLAAVERVTGGYGEHCAMCAASEEEDGD